MGKDNQVSSYTIYNDANDEVRSYTDGMPVQISHTNYVDSYVETMTVPNSALGTPLTPTASPALLSYSRSYFNLAGQIVDTRDYDLTSSSASYSTVSAANYLRTQFGYDGMGRQNRTVSASGNITRLFFDSLGRLSSTWSGTNDDPGNVNMVKLAEYEYDNGGVGDSNLTKTTTYPTSIYDKQVDQVWYDWRDRPIIAKSGTQLKSDGTNLEDKSTNRSIVYYTYNNSDQVVQTDVYDGDQFQPIGPSSPAPTATSYQVPNSTQLLARSRSLYDNLGREYKSQSFGVDPTTGAVAATPLTSSVWYDNRGNVIKATQPGGLVAKTTYDSLNEPIVSYITDGGGDSNYNDAGNVQNDIVFSQSEVQYDASGNPVLTATRERFHDQTTLQTGALDSSNSRPYFTAAYFDKYGRTTSELDFGTNGGVDITTRPSLVAGSDTVHRVDYLYGEMSSIDALWTQVTDAKGIASRQYSDSLGRTTKTVEAYDANNPTITATTNKTTEFFYDLAGHLKTVQSTLPSNKKQQTGYVYGSSFATGSFINDNDALVATQYAATSTDPALDGLASANEQVTQTIDATGNVLSTTDRNKTKHVFEYDVLGRMISDTVAESGFGVDTSIRRMGITYDSQGNAATLTSYSDPKGKQIANQVVRTFNNLGELTNEYQSHSGQVNLGSTLKVGYTYADPSSGNNGARQTGMVYPNGRTLTYNYASGTDDSISRLSSISDGTQTLESYQYLGLSTVVVRAHPVSKVDLTYVKQAGDAANADKYSGLDRFNRVIDQRWVKTETNPGTADRLQYTYDANDNVLSKTNTLDATKNETYTYDNLNQLTGYSRGAGAQTQTYTMDAMGNFQAVGTGTAATSQTRTTNSQNEISSITTGTGTSATTVTLTYDANGNLTKDETGALLTYDAWNRLVKVVKPVLYGTATVTYTYDTLGRRITETTVAPTRVNNTTVMVTTAKDLYYSKDWQVLEEREGGVAKTQYVWSPVYVDAMIERDRDVNGGSDGLEERLWPLQDANYNTTSLVDSNGTVTERYVYDPYGKVTVYAANGTTQATSNVDWKYLHQGGRLDTTTGLYNFRNRDYSPTLMRWTTNDPIGFGGGDTNTYRYLGNGPTAGLDPSGLQDIKKDYPRENNQLGPAGIKSTGNSSQFSGLPKKSLENRSDQVIEINGKFYLRGREDKIEVRNELSRSFTAMVPRIGSLPEELTAANRKIGATLKPNGPGVGFRYIHGTTTTLDFSKCENINAEKLTKIADQIYSELKDFRDFGLNNLADVELYKNVDGRDLAGFRTLGLTGVAASITSGDGPESRAFVHLTYQESQRRMYARTLGNHMLVGQRSWNVEILEGNNIRISTDTTDFRSSWMNEAGFLAPHPWHGWERLDPNGGAAMSVNVWDKYFYNIANRYKRQAEIKAGPTVSHLVIPPFPFGGP